MEETPKIPLGILSFRLDSVVELALTQRLDKFKKFAKETKKSYEVTHSPETSLEQLEALLQNSGPPSYLPIKAPIPEPAPVNLLQNSGPPSYLPPDVLFIEWPGLIDELEKDTAQALIKLARKNHVVVIGLTMRCHDSWDLRKAGGYCCLDWMSPRQSPVNWANTDWDDFFRECTMWLRNKPLSHTPIVVGYDVASPRKGWNDSEHLKLSADLERMRVPVVANLVSQLSLDLGAGAKEPHRPTSFEPGFVAKGYSGAVVFSAATVGKDGTEHKLFIKASRDGEKLARELWASEDSDGILYVKYRSSQPATSFGWYAIASDFTEDAITLQQYLSQGWAESVSNGSRRTYRLPDSKEVRGTITDLLGGLWEQEWRTRAPYSTNCSELLNQRVNTDDAALIVMAEEELEQPRAGLWLRKGSKPGDDPPNGSTPEHDQRNGLKPLANLLVRGCLGNTKLAEMKVSTTGCDSHGDLHSRNVLVTKSPSAATRVMLIDPAKRGRLYWPSDIARLSVDLWMNVFARSEAMLIGDDKVRTRVEEWHRRIAAWSGLTEEPARGTEDRVLDGLDAIKDRALRHFAEPIWNEWEFQFALLIEFLLHCTYTGIPLAKRCLAVYLANDLIEHLAATWPEYANGPANGGARPS